MSFDMLLQVLRTLKGLATKVTFVWFQGYVDANMGGDVIAFHGGRTTVSPLTGQVEIVRTLAANVTLTEVLLRQYVSAKARFQRQTDSRRAAPALWPDHHILPIDK